MRFTTMWLCATSKASDQSAQARLSLHLSKCHIVGNHMSQRKCICCLVRNGIKFFFYKKDLVLVRMFIEFIKLVEEKR